jgi:RNA polymerase sigma-70 factor (ECF subfamily)
MLHAHARREARRNAQGEFVPLAEQEVARWDAALADEAEALLLRASRSAAPGRYQLEAAVQSAHSVRRHGHHPDARAIMLLYEALHGITGSPVAALNRPVAGAEVHGPQVALAEIEAFEADPRLRDYQPFWAARAHLLAACGRRAEAQQAYQRAIGLERDPAVRSFLQARGRRA